MSNDEFRQAALDYHRSPTRGKISVVPTKGLTNQRDLALAGESARFGYPEVKHGIVAAIVMAAILDGGTRLLGRILPIGRGWRLLIVCLSVLLFMIWTAMFAGSQIAAQAEILPRPNVELLGINVYAGAVFDLPQRLRDAGITKPVVIAELGPLGQWQAGRKPWGAPVELTSTEKARFFTEALVFLSKQPQIRGAFPFLWGAKQEQTATWHGLLLADGSATGFVFYFADLHHRYRCFR